MMPVRLTRAVERETAVVVSGRVVIVRLEVGGRVLKFRRKGLRTEGWAMLPIEAAYWHAAKSTWLKDHAEREERKGRWRRK
jgi:hypothetical protein